ncbi:hypothetical protein ACKN8S_13495 (plasmid) [Limosilactobacillus reuteri]|uniref:hypothetical protein n=1 Tax=Limosilactobacillus reuteri TaxID=1598 RepID=UPI0039BFF6AB
MNEAVEKYLAGYHPITASPRKRIYTSRVACKRDEKEIKFMKDYAKKHEQPVIFHHEEDTYLY